ncbi:ankyrin repeat and protein kinase domain-containing protein 1 isoform X2 [Lacerta agilis]|uniref:ankyrin repeat and protein kinase domain-containing protein 1 isoform X2 n=1 Tax=Lacerta agilis TaxID=80427 RepID=UPI00141919F4|nr:ankyrin repeat and protein kinase domain-containing protein 1 isoform X2 [Lacerta agilis]
MDRHSGSLTMFTKEDFEDDWLKVASGVFGEVFCVRHKRWRTTFAVKCSSRLPQDSRRDRSSTKHLLEEAAKKEKIKFQHIVSIYGTCYSPLGIVMEYMANGSLEKILPTHQMSWQLKFRIIHETSLAVNFLHSLKPPLLHLNLKPGNILLDANMHVKISDFGLCKWMEESSLMEYIERSAQRGSLSYIPPEILLQSTSPPGTKFDVYSFGIVIWEILTQKKAYSGVKTMAVIITVATGQRPSMEPIRNDWPAECQQMVDLMKRCWDQEPQRRPSFTDVVVETDMLLSLTQCPVVDLENERFSRKMSVKPPFSRREQRKGINGSGPFQEAHNSENEKDQSHCFPQNEVESLEALIISEEVSKSHEDTLHLMVASGNLEKVKFLLKQGADVNERIACGYTPLILAVQKRSLETIVLLIQNGADVNMADEDNWSPLHFVAQNGDDRIARLLLDHKANVDTRELDGWTPLHLASQNNFENVVRVLLSRQADPNAQENEGRTALHMAACYGHIKLVKMLASQGADLEKKQRNLRTPLHLAVEKGKFRVVQYLLKNGVEVNSLDQNHYSALHMAVVKGKYLICEKLIKYGAIVDLRTDKGWTPLHLASIEGYVDIIHLLVDNHGKVNARGSLDWTPLHLAARYSEAGAVSELLRSGADPNAAENLGWTPLHLSVQRGAFLSILNLLEHKADVNIRNKVGWTPTHLAVLKDNVAIVKTLLDAGALLELEDNAGCTPLQLAIRNEKQSIVDLLQGAESSKASPRSQEG